MGKTHREGFMKVMYYTMVNQLNHAHLSYQGLKNLASRMHLDSKCFTETEEAANVGHLLNI